MSGTFHVHDENPNPGAGCLCNPNGDIDCKAPYGVFYLSETDSVHSPHVVLSAHCAAKLAKAVPKRKRSE